MANKQYIVCTCARNLAPNTYASCTRTNGKEALALFVVVSGYMC